MKIPVNLGKTEDRHGWNAGMFFWAECLCRPGKSDIDIFMSSVMAFGAGALGCNEVMRIEPQGGINVCAHFYA